MGEGYIVSARGRGLYNVQIIKNEGTARERIKLIDRQIGNIDVVLMKLEKDHATLTAAHAAAQENYLEFSGRYMRGEIEIGVLMAKKVAVSKANQAVLGNFRYQSQLKIQKLSLLKEKEKLTKALEPVERFIWCVDYTVDYPVGKKIGLLECDNDLLWINIEEGCQNKNAKGLMQPVQLSTPAGVFFNLAIMPAWQRHKPMYRAGRISEIDYGANHANVLLDNPNFSRATNICGAPDKIPINMFTNQPENPNSGITVLLKVPIKYMGCNASAFVNGDYVIVRFTDNDWGKPVIIGFHDNPRAALNLVQVRFTNVATNPALLTEFDRIIADANTMRDYFADFGDFIATYIDAWQGLVGKPRGYTAISTIQH